MGREIRFKNPKAPGTFKQLKGAACHLSNILAKDLKLDLKEKPGRRNKSPITGCYLYRDQETSFQAGQQDPCQGSVDHGRNEFVHVL